MPPSKPGTHPHPHIWDALGNSAEMAKRKSGIPAHLQLKD